MKHIHCIVALLLLILKFGTSNGQNYHPLLNDSTTWDASFLDFSLPACSETDLTRVFVNGDTVINSITYKRVSGYHAINITPMPCPVWAFDNTVLDEFALLREDTVAQKVWAYNSTIGAEYLLFDFSLLPGDTLVTSFNLDPAWPDSLLVDSVNMIQLLDGSFRKVIYMHVIAGVFIDEYMIEGIGGSAGLYLPPVNWGIGFETRLGCVIYNNDQLYNPTEFSTYCPGVTGNTNTIEGKAFVDLNNNLFYDIGDGPLEYSRVTETVSGMFDFTDAAGNYRVFVTDTGNFSVEGVIQNNFISNPLSQAANFNGYSQADSLNDFAYQPTSVFDDMELFMVPLHPIRSGSTILYRIRIKNKGTTNQFPELVFYQDPVLEYVSSSVNPNIITTDSIVWNLSNLFPFQKVDIDISFAVDTGLAIGTPVLTEAVVSPFLTDVTQLNNSMTHNGHIVGSFDPNDISVDRDTFFTSEMTSPPYLNYLIRFQNTGNDTAFVVRIENGLYQTLDISTLEFVSASHPLQMNWYHLTNRVEFVFENINLPDSNTNEPMSHGYIAYRIKPVSGLTAGHWISNYADIYFDLNLPVSTNYVWTHIVEPTAIAEYISDVDGFNVYPNPVGDKLLIRFDSEFRNKCDIQVFDIFGRIQQQHQIENVTEQVDIDTGNLSAGMYLVKISKGTSSGMKKIIKL